MMKNSFLGLSMTLITTLILVGCQKPPQATKDSPIQRVGPDRSQKDTSKPIVGIPETPEELTHLTDLANTEISPHDQCQELTEAEKKLLSEPSLSENAKMKLIDNFMIARGGAKCKNLADSLRALYHGDPVSDLVGLRQVQITRLSSADIVRLAYELSDAGSTILLDAADVWKQADKKMTYKKTPDGISVESQVSFDGRTVKLIAQFTTSDLNKLEPAQDEVIKALAGQKLRFLRKDDKVIVLSNLKTTPTADLDEQKLVQDIVKVSREDKVKRESRGAQIKKYAFDTTDKESLELCDNGGITRRVLQKKKNDGATADIAGVTMEEGMIPAEIVGKSAEEITKMALAPSAAQKIDGQSFWHFATTNNASLRFHVVTSANTDQNKVEKPIKTEFIIYRYDAQPEGAKLHFVREEALIPGTTTKALSYKPDDTPHFKRYIFYFDPSSAYWIKDRVERMTSCLEKENIAAPGASRDSVAAYALLTVVGKEVKYYLDETH